MEKARNISHKRKAEWLLVDLGFIGYKEAHDLQLHLVEAKKAGRFDRDVVLFLEHPSVFTLGRRGGLDNLKVPETFIDSRGIQIIHVERGGDITYHGPGQLVVYPIVDLKAGGWRVLDFVEALEEVMIRTMADWGIRAERNPLNRGAWVGRSKIGSVGIGIRRSISFHGLALNINTELEPFTWVFPCGLQGVGITSMKEQLGKDLPMDGVRRAAASKIEEVFDVTLDRVTREGLLDLLDPSSPGREKEAI